MVSSKYTTAVKGIEASTKRGERQIERASSEMVEDFSSQRANIGIQLGVNTALAYGAVQANEYQGKLDEVMSLKLGSAETKKRITGLDKKYGYAFLVNPNAAASRARSMDAAQALDENAKAQYKKAVEYNAARYIQSYIDKAESYADYEKYRDNLTKELSANNAISTDYNAAIKNIDSLAKALIENRPIKNSNAASSKDWDNYAKLHANNMAQDFIQQGQFSANNIKEFITDMNSSIGTASNANALIKSAVSSVLVRLGDVAAVSEILNEPSLGFNDNEKTALLARAANNANVSLHASAKASERYDTYASRQIEKGIVEPIADTSIIRNPALKFKYDYLLARPIGQMSTKTMNNTMMMDMANPLFAENRLSIQQLYNDIYNQNALDADDDFVKFVTDRQIPNVDLQAIPSLMVDADGNILNQDAFLEGFRSRMISLNQVKNIQFDSDAYIKQPYSKQEKDINHAAYQSASSRSKWDLLSKQVSIINDEVNGSLVGSAEGMFNPIDILKQITGNKEDAYMAMLGSDNNPHAQRAFIGYQEFKKNMTTKEVQDYSKKVRNKVLENMSNFLFTNSVDGEEQINMAINYELGLRYFSGKLDAESLQNIFIGKPSAKSSWYQIGRGAAEYPIITTSAENRTKVNRMINTTNVMYMGKPTNLGTLMGRQQAYLDYMSGSLQSWVVYIADTPTDAAAGNWHLAYTDSGEIASIVIPNE